MNWKFHKLLAGVAACLVAAPSANAQYSPDRVVGVAERELARRQSQAGAASTFIADGNAAMRANDFERAVNAYGDALQMLPDSLATSTERQQAVRGYSEASVKFAQQLIMQGRRADAETILKRVIEVDVNPGYRPVLQVLANMEDPSFYNPSVTPGHVEKVDRVKQLLIEAQGFLDLGRYDLAHKRYEQVLNIDKYNIAARAGMERVNAQRQKYADQAYNETRSRLLWQVSKQWELPYRNYDLERPVGPQGQETGSNQIAAQTRKMESIILPVVDFRDATIREAIEFLRSESRRLDVAEPDPTRRGVNIVLQLGTSSPGAPPAIDPATGAPVPGAPDPNASIAAERIRLSLTNVPLATALGYVCDMAGLKYKVEPFAIRVVPQSENIEDLITREFRVSPDLFTGTAATEAGGATGGAASPFGFPAGGGAAAASAPGRIDAKQILSNYGVVFPEGASAFYLRGSSRLVVKNTPSNLDLIEQIVSSEEQELQVEIETKFIEVQQDKLKELGFDWLLGQFNVGGGNVFAGGGTAGNGTALDTANYPFTAPGATTPVGTFPLTAGNRSGSAAITGDSIGALLAGATGGGSLIAPAIFGLAGVFSDPQFQVVIRALNQSKAVDLMSAPRVVTQSGTAATVEVIREFIYPTEFDPPQIPNEVGTGGSILGGLASANSFPVTPTTPTAFETRNTGVTLNVTPDVKTDRFTINLDLEPTVVEFEGFINYGSPIGTSAISALGIPQTVILTPNEINQPIFSTRRVKTKVSIWDGQTVTLGGLMREDIQKVDDKVPVIGDIPLLGRLFRSSSEQHLKRNLIIFVTARLLDPAGQLINAEDEEEELVESLIGPDSPLPPPNIPIYAK